MVCHIELAIDGDAHPQLPSLLISSFNVPFYFGGTALLIVVGVALDTAGQIETHLLTRQYEGFMKKGRIARRR